MSSPVPPRPRTNAEIENLLSRPTDGVLAAVRALGGDFLVLGVGGKMGTSLALMLRRALDTVGRPARVLGVSRFSRPDAQAELAGAGVVPLACDLADAAQVAGLPEAANVLYLAGQKFGTSSAPEATWIQNVVVPANVAQRFHRSRIVVFSTGCVYPFQPTTGPHRGATETTPVAFLGEYASTCVGRERVFTYYSKQYGTEQLLFRLNYAVELRYGVLVDLASAILAGRPVDLTTGFVNLIWQGDACARAIQCLQHVAHPPRILNVTGAERVSVRALAERFGALLGRTPTFSGREADSAWLADAGESVRLFGPPDTSLDTMMHLVAEHLLAGGQLLGKPTHFQTRDGTF